MKPGVDVQVADGLDAVPDAVAFRCWVEAALRDERRRASVSIRVAGRDEVRALNARFRGQDNATNVLSFPADGPATSRSPLLGDIVLCAPIIEAEAHEQGKSSRAHWAHMTVHGTLHLLGYDHERDDDAVRMESVEIDVLRRLGVANPYDLSSPATARGQGARG